jgi:putative transposase
MIDEAVTELKPLVGVRNACGALGASQAGYWRRHRQSPAPARPAPIPHRQRRQPRALSAAEQQAILDALHSDRFADLAPAEVWATRLDEGVYLGSQSTFYRLLRQAGEVRERRRQATHPATVKPELMASIPNEVWSWDITKLRGPAKWTYYYLYLLTELTPAFGHVSVVVGRWRSYCLCRVPRLGERAESVGIGNPGGGIAGGDGLEVGAVPPA